VKLEVKDVERWMNMDEHGWKWKTLLENEWTLEMKALLLEVSHLVSSHVSSPWLVTGDS
jgi:nitrogen fixation protein